MTSHNKGFSLMEVLIAMLVLAIGILGLVKLQSFMQQRTELAEHQMMALGLAEKQLEEYRTRTREGGGVVSNSLQFDKIKTESLTKVGVFNRNVVVTKKEYKPAQPEESSAEQTAVVYAKHIEVTVSWEDRAGKTQQVALQTVVAAFSEFD